MMTKTITKFRDRYEYEFPNDYTVRLTVYARSANPEFVRDIFTVRIEGDRFFSVKNPESQFPHKSEGSIRNGVLYWDSNNRPVPFSTCEEMGFSELLRFDAAAQKAADEEYTHRTLGAYREARKNYKPSAEEIFEMTAAFGPGAVVRDVVTGQKFKMPGRRTRRS